MSGLKRLGKLSLATSAAVAALTMFAPGALAQARAQEASANAISIESQDLGSALRALARQTGTQIVFDPSAVRGRRAPEIRNAGSPEQALQRMLADSGLTYRATGRGTYTILAQAVEVPPTQTGATDFAAPVEEEIVVTAQKREERLMEAPVSVSVLNAEETTAGGATQFRDYASTIPSLTFATQGVGETQITLRGVTTGTDVGPTVGIYVDEVPYGSSTVYGQGVRVALDVGLLDIDHVEVVRGPQGTLYGASSMGGVIKYVTREPDSHAFGGALQGGVSVTEDGGTNYNAALSLNLPLAADVAGLRVSAYENHDAGYIDNLQLGQDNVNRSDIYGGRADLLLTPSEALSIRLTAFLQNVSRDGEGTADYAFDGSAPNGELETRRFIEEPFDQEFRMANATVEYDFGEMVLTSATGYQEMIRERVRDDRATVLCGFAIPTPFACSAAAAHTVIGTDKWTQELRLSSDSDSGIEWLIGAFYTSEESTNNQEYVLRDPAGQPINYNMLQLALPSTYEEIALFGDVTFDITPNFDVTLGARYAENDQHFQQTGSGQFGRSAPPFDSEDNVTTYLVNARYHINEDSILYARYATGYRPGSPNVVVTNPSTGLPNTTVAVFEPDELSSYELGYKAEFADGIVVFDTGIYHIDWENVQVASSAGGFGITLNAPGGATIDGAEFAVRVRPIDPLTITTAITYQDASINENTPQLGALAGDPLPNVPDFTASMSVDYDFTAFGAPATLGGSVRFIDDRNASYDNNLTFRQYHLPEYTIVDFRASFDLDVADLNFFLRNAFDERGQISANTFQGLPRPAITQPRTVGVSLTRSF